MASRKRGGWVYIMANRYRGAIYVGVTSDLSKRIYKHREGGGSDYAYRRELKRLVWADHFDGIELAIAHEKRVKRWHRKWKIDLIEKSNPEWDDLFDRLLS